MGPIVLDENLQLPERLVWRFAAIFTPLAVFLRFVANSYGFLESLGVCFIALCIIVRCNYSVSGKHEGLLFQFRLRLSLLVGLFAAISLSYEGMAVRQFDILDGLIFGTIAILTTHILGIVASCISDPLLKRVRRFRSTEECRRCAYNLTGSTGTICPECGAAIQPYQRVALGLGVPRDVAPHPSTKD